MKKKLERFGYFLTLKVRILPFVTTFTQLTARLKNFLMGWLLVLSLKECLVECATVCVKSVVILKHMLSNCTDINLYQAQIENL